MNADSELGRIGILLSFRHYLFKFNPASFLLRAKIHKQQEINGRDSNK